MSLGVRCCVVSDVVTRVSKDCGVFNFRFKQSKNNGLDVLTIQDESSMFL